MAAPVVAAVALPAMQTLGKALATDLFVYRTTGRRRKGRPPDEYEFHLNGFGIFGAMAGIAVAKWVINGMPWPGSSTQGGSNPLLGIAGPAVAENQWANALTGILTGSWWSPWW